MGFQLSPGINITEIDLTTIIPAVGTTVGAIAGPFQWGPANKPMLIDSELTLLSTFGKPDNTTANTWFTAANFLSYANALQTVRVVKETGAGAHKNATADGTGLLIANEDVYLNTYASGQGSVGMFAAKYPGALGNSLAVSIADANSFATWAYKTSFDGKPDTSSVVLNGGGENDEIHVVVVDTLGSWTGVPGQVLERFAFLSKSVDAKYEDGSTIYYPEVINRKSKYVWWMDHPAAIDLGQTGDPNWGEDKTTTFDTTSTKLTLTGITGSFTVGEVVSDSAAVTVTPAGSGATATAVLGFAVASATVGAGGSGYTAATVAITGGGGTGATATATVGGGAVTAINITAGGTGYTSAPTITISGDGTGATATAVLATSGAVKSVTVGAGGTLYGAAPNITFTGGSGSGATATSTVSGGQVTAINVSAGGSGYTTPPTVVITSPGSGATASVTVNGAGKIIAVTPTANGTGYTSAPIVTVQGPGSGASITAVLGTGGTATQVVSYTINNGGTGYSTVSGTVLAWNTPELEIAPLTGVFEVGDTLAGGTSSAAGEVSVIAGGALTVTLTGGVDGNGALLEGDYMEGYDKFRSGEDIDVSLVLGADATSTVAIYLINDIAEYRKDCVVFLSPPKDLVVDNAGSEAADIVDFRNQLPSSSYAVMDSGWKYQYDKYSDIYRWVPLNGDVAGLCVRTDNERDPWWSPAGYNRGQIKNVVRLAWNPRRAYRDVLYQGGVNPVMTDPGQGTILFGDKTLLAKPSAFDRINVRRLFIVIEKAIATASKFTLFEFNDKFTRAQFVNMVEPYLRDVQGRRGIYDFRVVCDETNNTPEVIDSNRFIGDIYVKPARSINFIQLNFVAVRTGVEFSEIVGKF